ncbi:PTS mannose transporter subunit IIAB [Weissella diestrammenae]|uniref:PTS system mannose-specific EIIAB component n=1 Tax=Weissella diestrammenae TaxID=1162633 RepID=A0A7G9T441_9LACO|nr:mannose/fructose/sorbose PTS transporter subunit IIA [Weissella diestrammenae]MCM0583387.1 PTS sugar transporter subunit IIB [Weissella diestrammenae]QNN74866.1 PTS mannose transporter subunit IIAB [Weissella diestrammenae]
MVNFIIASHGEFAAGIKMSGQMIFGEQENVQVVTFMPNEGPDDLRKKLLDAVEQFDGGLESQVLFLVDLWGGSPFNQANLIVAEHADNMAIISGLNLPMLVEAYGARFSKETAAEIAQYLVPVAKEGVKSIPEAEVTETDKPAKVANPVGLKPGKIKINLVRIDTRLLHGQVATAWTPESKANRIIVVSDAVANDELRKGLIAQAAPNGVHANVVPISKMIEVMNDDRMGGVEAFLLFENPEDALAAIEGGVPIKEINVGSMAHSTGKTMVNKVLSMDKRDVETFEKLRDLGVEFDVRKVPNDSKANLFDLIQKANVQ